MKNKKIKFIDILKGIRKPRCPKAPKIFADKRKSKKEEQRIKREIVNYE